jgi:serine/threonine-protein kinase RsbW
MPDAVVRLSFPAKAEYLLLARLALAGLARRFPMDEEVLADLKLAVTEACGNAVRHAYAGDGGRVDVSYVVSDDRLQMIVADEGIGLVLALDGEAASQRADAEARPEELGSGMGMAIIRAIVDELEVRDGAHGQGTVVHMTKYLPPAPLAD